MKRSLLTLILNLCLACVAMTAWSQNLMLNQEEPEDEIAVVGYFCKNDTMTYRQTHNKYKIQGNDTTVSESYVEEFMIVVTDSTSDGYKMKYIPLSFTLHDAEYFCKRQEDGNYIIYDRFLGMRLRQRVTV